MTTCLDAVYVRNVEDFDSAEQEYVLQANYVAYVEDTAFESVDPELYQKKTKAQQRAEREAAFEAKMRAEKAEAKRLKREAKMDPKELLALKEAELAADPDYLVARVNIIKHAKANIISGSTGRSEANRKLTSEIDRLKGVQRAKPGPKTPGALATGESRARVVSNAMNNSANLIKVLTDQAEHEGLYLRMQTITFSDKMPLLYRVAAVERIRKLFDRRCQNYVMVWGIGSDGEQLVDPIDGLIAKDRLHMHMHCFNIQGTRRTFLKAVQKVMDNDPKFARYEYSVNNQRIAKKVIKAKGYHMAVYGAINIEAFKPMQLEAIVNSGVYSQDALDELDRVRSKTGMRLYMAGAETNRALRDRTTNEEVKIVRNGQDALNQVLLRFHEVTEAPIEHTDIHNPSDDKFFVNHDKSTIDSYRRILATPFVPGETKLPGNIVRAWTLHKEAGYKPTRSFMDWVRQNPDVHYALEKKRTDRKLREAIPTDADS